LSVSRKPLRSVAHSVAHSFTSVMNYGRYGHAIEHIVQNAIKFKEGDLVVDLRNGATEPSKLLTKPVQESIIRYSGNFPSLVRRSGSSMHFVRTATLTLTVDWANPRQTSWMPAAFHYPLQCEVVIESDLGRRYSERIRHMWPAPPPRPWLLRSRRAS
jgi:hypothetical protein